MFFVTFSDFVHSCYLLLLHLFFVQMNNVSGVSSRDNSYSVTASHQSPFQRLNFSARKAVSSVVGEHYEKLSSMVGGDVTELCAVNTVSLSPEPGVTYVTTAGCWLNRSLPAQSRCRVSSEDGTATDSRRLRHGRPNSLKSGLHHSLLQRPTGTPVPVIGAKEVVAIDTSPILSTYSVTSAVHETNEHFATGTSDETGSTLICSRSQVSLNAQMETTLDNSKHNQAFTESMLGDPNFVDSSSVDAADESCADTVTAESGDKDVVTCCEWSKLSSVVKLSQSVMSAGCCDPVQSSTTSLDSAVDATMPDNESHLDDFELHIPRTFSKQSIISHDSGVSLAERYLLTADAEKLTHVSHARSHCIGLGCCVRRKSAVQNPNLQVTSDVQNLLFKAGVVPLNAVSDTQKEYADKRPSSGKLKCLSGSKAMTSECDEHMMGNCAPAVGFVVNLPSTVSRHQSKLLPVLPISTNLLRVQSEQYSVSAKRCIASSAAVAVASPAVSVGLPPIKSALLTPSFKQCLAGADGTSQLRSRLRGKPVKCLQLSPYPSHSPVNPLSPRHVTTSRQTTVAVPFDLDV